MDLIVPTYLSYLLISVLLTVWVARTLHKNGRVFLLDVFRDEALADSVNHLLVVGFYLVNLGYVALHMRHYGVVDTTRIGLETLTGKLGGVLIILGLMHFFNLFVFSRIRRRARLPEAGATPAGSTSPVYP